MGKGKGARANSPWKTRIVRFGFAEERRLGGIGGAVAMGDLVGVL